ncbi:hypothetical protein FDECE_13529 [Fusarium decemcellulare]|nr:hypothetical protein FDECE_13529 [Fusarium decemcellulare]
MAQFNQVSPNGIAPDFDPRRPSVAETATSGDTSEYEISGQASRTTTPSQAASPPSEEHVHQQPLDFWALALRDCASTLFPTRPLSPSHATRINKSLEHVVPLKEVPGEATVVTLVRAAWALVVGQVTDTQDVVFGLVVPYGSSPKSGHGQVTIAPLRLKWKNDQTTLSYLNDAQKHAIDVAHHGHIGLEMIAKSCLEAQHACEFQTLMVCSGEEVEALQGMSPDAYALVLEILPAHGKVHVRATFDATITQSLTLKKLFNRLEIVMSQLSACSNNKVSDIDLMTAEDLSELWSWNRTVPVVVERCIHSAIEDQVKGNSEGPAICAWDGNLSYGELDRLASQVAGCLLANGVMPGMTVGLCFDKSMWVPIAQLGVLKTGAIILMLDPSLPEQRLQSIVTQVRVALAVAAPAYQELGSRLCGRTLVLNNDLVTKHCDVTKPWLDRTDPSSAAYIQFSSGSTGVPKGSIITHKSVSSAIQYQVKPLGLDRQSRILDFSSYSFDMSFYNTFLALCAGGCLCIPSETGRKNDLARSIKKLQASVLILTPSTAQLLKPDQVPSVKCIVIGGETLDQRDLAPWWDTTRLVTIYGPSECTPVSLINHDRPSLEKMPELGRGCGVVTWVVDKDDHERLLPPGCIGELVLEGPLVGAGYLDPQRNVGIYIDSPAWLRRGAPGQVGRTGRLYKTGDLACRHEDGEIVFFGRKDSQVKIRGQRVELAEVEHSLQQRMPEVEQLAVEIISPRDSSPMLAVFLLYRDRVNSGGANPQLCCIPDDVLEDLAKYLPSYMIPSVFFSVDDLPTTTSGKRNRKYLQELGASLSLSDLAPHGYKEQPVSDLGRQLQAIWAQILNIEAAAIGLDDTFFQVGGDSIAAMKVVRDARETGIGLSVADILSRPNKLRDVVARASCSDGLATNEIPSFSLLPHGCNVEQVLRDHGLNMNHVQDVYPCTPLQEGLVALSSKRPGDYVMQAVLELSSDISLPQLCHAWKEVVRTVPLLRTRFVQDKHAGLVQVVVDESIDWVQAAGLDEYLEADRAQPMPLGRALTRFALVENERGQVQWFVLTAHHALYDGWSLGLIMDAADRAYRSEELKPNPPFQLFIQQLLSHPEDAMYSYWQKTLLDCEAVPFPALPQSITQPTADRLITYKLPNPQPHANATISTMIHSAWALVVGCLTNSDDVVFGTTVSGRNAAVAGIGEMPGPTIATVPRRFLLSKNQTVDEFLAESQRQATEMIPHEQMGLRRIAKLSADGEQACRFQTLVVTQPEDDARAGAHRLLGKLEERDLMKWSSSYGLVLEVQLGHAHSIVTASFDSRLIESSAVQHLLERLEHVLLSQFDGGSAKKLSDVQMATPEDLKLIWRWNKSVDEPVDRCIHDMMQQNAAKHPGKLVISAWDGKLTYHQLDSLSTKLAVYLGTLNISPEAIIPCCFEKSMWTTVAVMGVLKAGGAFVLLDPSLPLERLGNIVAQVDARLILASGSCKSLASRLTKNVITVDAESLSSISETQTNTSTVDSSSAAYVLFTSGSTGTPKGVLVTHQNVASTAPRYIEALEYTSQSRIYDFASYSFGAALSNMFAVIITGGCLCVPSEDDRRSNIAGSITALQATDVLLTPSVADFLSPEEVPTLKNLILGGEAVRSQDVTKWWGRVQVRTAYGSSECTTIGVINGKPESPEDAASIGFGVGQTTWVVDPDNHNRLLPPGAIGELLLEGPAVARGYLGDTEKTSAVFIRDPTWLVEGGRTGRLYKSGDLVRYRPDGSLEVLGRKDAQVKIRGQRIEPGEVEHWLRETMPRASQVAVEVITPQGPNGRPMLAAFLTIPTDSDKGAQLLPIDSRVEAMLSRHLPTFMVPSVFIAVAALPMTPSGKINRRQLKALGSTFTVSDLAQSRTAAQGLKPQPVSAKGRELQRIWAEVLELQLEGVGLDDSFFQLGGDSVSAVKVVGEARKSGIELLVTDIFQHRTLKLVAQNSRQSPLADSAPEKIEPFSLLGESLDTTSFRNSVASQCDVEQGIVQDAYPCTPLQEGLVSLAMKRPGDYMMQAVIELPSTVSLDNFKAAWEAAARAAAVMRVRIVQDDTFGLLQVVLNQGIDWIEATGLQDYLQADRALPLKLSLPLTRYALVKDRDSSLRPRWFVWTVHHALYDGWSLPLLLDYVNMAYLGQQIPEEPSVQRFVKYVISQIHDRRTESYWRAALFDCECAPFPLIPPSMSPPAVTDVVQHAIPRSQLSALDTTPSVLLRAAWGLVTGRMTNSDDVIFGVVVSGRNAPVTGLDKITAPTIATVPLRVRPRANQKVLDYLRSVRQQATDMMPFEQTGLSRIKKICPGAQQACKFQTLLVVQPQSNDSNTTEYSFGTWQNNDQTKWFNTYALTVQVQVGASEFHVNASFDAAAVQPWLVDKLIKELELVIRQLEEATPRQTVRQIGTMTDADVEEIWTWNCQVPESRDEACLHSLFERQAEQHPEKLAVCARDGNITYEQLDQLSNTLAAQLGDCSGILIPLCFEKSMWTPVAILATLKAGGAFVLLDPFLPKDRLKATVSQTASPFIISSIAQADLSSHLADAVIQVGPPLLTAIPDANFVAKSPPISAPVFAVFTSGSTGSPKGTVFSHASFASGLYHQLSPLGFTSESRVFDFASYASHTAVHNVFAAFTLGGCLCVPSECERQGNFEKAMADMRITIANLTPSVSRALNPEEMPHLKRLILAGEELTLSDAQKWNKSHVSLVNAYSAAECSIGTINTGGDSPRDALYIGKGVGVVAWVVDPQDHNVLLPAGSTGELVLEGPPVGIGYLNDPTKTAACFIEDPVWLTKGCSPRFPGRRGRVYKTGDLVRLNKDGTLVYLGQKGVEVTLKGQRVDFGEVEDHVAACFSPAKVVCEIALIEGKSLLVAFLETDYNEDNGKEILTVDPSMEDKLSKELPSHMVPSGVVKMKRLPMTPTGKMDRKHMRKLAAGLKAEQIKLASGKKSVKEQPKTETQRKLQHIWCRVLGLSPEEINLDDSFFRLGGDSITVMRVISQAHKQGIELSAADIFKYRTLREVSGQSHSIRHQVVAPFSLIGKEVNVERLIGEISAELHLESPAAIQDIYPCTSLQQGLVSLSAKRPGDYVAQATLDISSTVDIKRFCLAWDETIRQLAILRTRIVQHDTLGLLQVVLEHTPTSWIETTDLEAYLETDRRNIMTVPEPLARYALVKDTWDSYRSRYFVWTVHHALYDGWSMPLIMSAITQAYEGQLTSHGAQFSRFVQHIQSIDQASVDSYWRQTLADCDCEHFPPVSPSIVDQPEAEAVVRYKIQYTQGENQALNDDITTSALVRAAWALVLSQATSSPDVVFGQIMSGRNVPVPGINEMTGPTIATVPIRINLASHSTSSTRDFLAAVQQQMADMMPHEQAGLHRIAKLSPSARHACNFQSLLLVQPEGISNAKTDLGTWADSQSQRGRFLTYALILEVHLSQSSSSMAVEAWFNPRVIDEWLVQRLLRRLEFAMQQLLKRDRVLGEVDTLTSQDLDQVWRHNTTVPGTMRKPVIEVLAHIGNIHPEQTITCDYLNECGVLGWVVDPDNPNRLVAPGKVGELLLEGPILMPESSNDHILEAKLVRDPGFLTKGTVSQAGRSGTLYKTDQLVKHSDGTGNSLLHLGCKDHMGLRPRDRQEIEHWVQQLAPEATRVFVETVALHDENGANEVSHSILAAFLLMEGTESPGLCPFSEELEKQLSENLPEEMMPRAFFAIGSIPLETTTTAANLDSKKLREIAGSFTARQVTEAHGASNRGAKRQPSSWVERQLQDIWGSALGLDPDSIGLDDSFFHLGGDSITAMRVASQARKAGITLKVDQLFQHPRLGDAASKARLEEESTAVEPIAAFALLGAENTDEIINTTAAQCGIEAEAIEDAFPCTPLQQGLVSITCKRPGAYVMQSIIELAPSISRDRLKVQLRNMGLLQIVLNEDIRWTEASDLEAYLKADRAQAMDIGQPLVRYAMIETAGGATSFVWTVHHALYDGWSMSLILNAVELVLGGESVQPWPQFQPFIRYMSEQDDEASNNYWANAFSGCEATPFPAIPPGVEDIVADQFIEETLPQPQFNPQLGITASALVRTAWALVLGSATTSTDVVFGMTLSGRNAPVPDIESIPAPTLATVPYRVVIPPASEFVSAFLSTVQSQATEMMPFEHTGLHRISKISAECAQACAFQTLLVLNSQAIPDAATTMLTFGQRRDRAQTEWFNTYALMLEVSWGTDDMTVHASFDSHIVERWMVEKLIARLRSVLRQLSSGSEEKRLIGDIQVMTEQDLEDIWKWNSGGVLPDSVDRCLHDLVDEVIQEQPAAQAVEAWDGNLSYGELGRLSNHLASQLTRAGVSGIVPLCFEKSMWTPIAMLAVLKAGAAFMLLDSLLPEKRLQTIVNQVNPDIIISSVANQDLGLRLARAVVVVGPDLHQQSTAVPQQTRVPTQPSDTMFVVFTSGSTGTPKGVAISHANLSSGFNHQLEKLGFNKQSRVFDFTTYSFDLAVHSVMATFRAGGCLCIPSDEERGGDVTAVMRKTRATIGCLTPTVARLLEPSALPDIKTLVMLGEPVVAEDAARWWGRRVSVMNGYGPAEATVFSTINNTSRTPDQVTRIGTGAGLLTWIVHPDNHDLLLPPGCVGELLLEGPLVGHGYLHDAEKTAAAFIHDPAWLVDRRPGRMYKTGDLVRYNRDGSLTYKGRKDLQVKIRGQRIELGEVEHCLRDILEHNAQAVIVEAVAIKDAGTKTLAVFVVWAEQAKRSHEAEPFSPDSEFMDRMRERLSLAMTPTIFVSLPCIPLTPTGKTDRKHLRETGSCFSAQQMLLTDNRRHTPKAQPTTLVQKQMQEIWADVLNIDLKSVGLDDNFTRLGGDSIAAMKVVGSARQIGLSLSVADMFRYPRLRNLTSSPKLAAVSNIKLDPIPRVEESRVVQSFEQGRLWFMDQLYPGLTWYHMPLAVRLQGDLKLDALELALQGLEERHETLRTRFETCDGVYLQHVQPFQSKSLVVVDLSSHGDIDTALQEHQWKPFYLTREPGWRVCLFRLSEDKFVLSIVMHHIISDGWSLQVLRKDLEALYKAALTHRNPLSQLNPLPIQYRDYAVWQKSKCEQEKFRNQLDYWAEKLQTSRPAEILCDKHRPKALSGDARHFEFQIEGQVYARLQSFCRDRRVTPFTVLLAAFRATHYRLTGVEDATIGTPNANRSRSELSDIIGFFVNLQCLRLRLEDSSTFADLVQHVHQTTAESFDNQDVPFEQIVARLNRERSLSRHPIVQILFALQAQGTAESVNLEGLTSETLDVNLTSRFDLELHMFEVQGALHGGLAYSIDLYDDDTIRSLLSIFRTILESGLKQPESKIATLQLLTDESYTELDEMGLMEIERTSYPRELSVTDVFTQQARANPDSIAVKDVCTALTYSELERQSTLVARWLARRGFAPESPVPIMSRRSCETIVAFLGIMKAGLAYLPIEAAAPVGRLETLLSHVQGCRIVILGRDVAFLDTLASKVECKRIMDMVHDEEHSSTAPRMPPAPGPESIAYTLFTSGSTGTPKGVMIEHRAILRLCLNSNVTRYLSPGGAMAHMASLVFDVCAMEIYAALLNGLTLVCLSHEVILDHSALGKAFTDQRYPIHAACITPAHLKQILLADQQILQCVHTLIVGGDRLNPDDCFQARSVMSPGSFLLNGYGPTENTIYSTIYHLATDERATNGVPIGRAVSNSGAYVMDPKQRLVPLGVIGELVVTGDGLARGYTDVERNKDSFVDIAIRGGPPVRAYRTGDYVRWRPSDGQIEFFGRMDAQVKIRGHRIEVGEIEHMLQGHSAVTDAVVLAHQRTEGQPAQLFGFVTTDDMDGEVNTAYQNGTGEKAGEVRQVEEEDADEMEHIGRWGELFDADKYIGIEEIETIGRDFMAWTSMYDGSTIDKGEMNEWLDDTISSIRSSSDLAPGHVLELGSGSGMILFNLAQGLESYIGVDPSPRAIDYVATTAKSIPQLADKVQVYTGTADRLDRIPGPLNPNLVVCNSVAQYFPSQEYLFDVIAKLVKLDGVETLFFGDMRSYALYREFGVTKTLFARGDDITKEELRMNLAEMDRSEMEFLADPAIFTALQERLGEWVEHVEILPKRIRATNELSCYRYAAVIHVKSSRQQQRVIHEVGQDWIDFAEQGLDRPSLIERLRSASSDAIVPVRNIPYSKTIFERLVVDALSYESEHDTNWLAAMRKTMADWNALSAYDLNEIAQQTGYQVEISWACQHSLRGGFDAIFHRMASSEKTRTLFRFPNDHQERAPSTLSSKPLQTQMRQKLREQLEACLKENLPSYMIPHKLTILDRMPINVSGKVDRKALAATIRARIPTSKGITRQPNTGVERILQSILAKVLNVQASSVGLDDNFFQLGGDSISAMRVVGEARKMDIELAVADVFRSDSLEKLALACSDAQSAVSSEDQQPLVHPKLKMQLLHALDKGGFANFSSADVADILPMTSMQQRYIREGEAHGQFAHYFFFDLGHVDVERLRASCIQTLEALPILRARFLPLLGKLWQVIPLHLNLPFAIQDTEQSLKKASDIFCKADMKTTASTEPPVSFTLLRNNTEGTRLVMRLSHAQYDGACIPVVIQSLVDGYLNKPTSYGPDYSRFLSYAARLRPASLDYWSQLLRGSSSATSLIPRLQYSALRGDKPRQIMVKSQVIIPKLPRGITTATLSSAAWALLLSRLNGSHDVVYGHIVTGRNAPIPGLGSIVGACLNIVPVRARLTTSQTGANLLRELQDQFASMGSADTLGYEDIISECTDWSAGAQFDHIIHHANIDEHPEFDLGDKRFRMEYFYNREQVPDYVTMLSYPLVGRIQFDLLTQTGIMSHEVAQGVVDGLCAIVKRLGEDDESVFTWLENLDLKI